MLRSVLTVALVAALSACSQGSDEANPAPSDAAAAVDQPSAASADAARAAYQPFFDQRWADGPAVTPAEVRTMIDEQGANAAVTALWGDDSPSRWDTVLRGIASGDQVWLDLVPALAPGTDAATAETLPMALSEALIANPVGALRTMGPDTEGYCVEGGFETPVDQTSAFYAAAIASVESVDDPALQDAKTACLAELRANSSPAVN